MPAWSRRRLTLAPAGAAHRVAPLGAARGVIWRVDVRPHKHPLCCAGVHPTPPRLWRNPRAGAPGWRGLGCLRAPGAAARRSGEGAPRSFPLPHRKNSCMVPRICGRSRRLAAAQRRAAPARPGRGRARDAHEAAAAGMALERRATVGTGAPSATQRSAAATHRATPPHGPPTPFSLFPCIDRTEIRGAPSFQCAPIVAMRHRIASTQAPIDEEHAESSSFPCAVIALSGAARTMKRTAPTALHGPRCWAVEYIVAVSKGRCWRWNTLLAQRRQWTHRIPA